MKTCSIKELIRWGSVRGVLLAIAITLPSTPAATFISQQAYLKASNTGTGVGFGEYFGYSVAVSGDTVVVGGPGEDGSATGVNGNQSDDNASDAGAAYIFVREGTNWTQQAYLKASNTAQADQFGNSLAVSGNTVVIGAVGEDSNATGVNGDQSDNSAQFAGAAYVFVRNGTTWTQQAYLKASNTGEFDNFGGSVAVSGDTVVVGPTGDDSNATDSGAAYVFVRNGTSWTQEAYLKASNTGTNDAFGYPVAVSGDTVVVAATAEGSNATGVDGNQNNNSATDSGAAYIFVRNGTNWVQRAYLKASNTGAFDEFGFSSVAVSGDTVVIGAWQEDSNATGVNGNQNTNSATDSGAAYIFTGLGTGPRLDLLSDGSGGYILRFNGIPDLTYRLQRAPNVTGPWSAIATNTAPASGLIEYHETTPLPGAAFYRTVTP